VTAIDANVVLRYLLDDIPEQSHEAARIIENDTVLIPHEVVAEVVYVLSGVYDIGKKDIVSALQRLLAYRTVRTTDRKVLLTAIDHFQTSDLDFVDCLLVGYAAQGVEVATFDKQLQSTIRTMGESD